MAADLLNTAEGMRSAQHSPEELPSADALEAFIADHQEELRSIASGASRASAGDPGPRPPSASRALRTSTADDVARVHELRERTTRFWAAVGKDDSEALRILNTLIEGVSTVVVADEAPPGADDGVTRYHREPVPPSDAPAEVLRAHIAQGLQEILVMGETERLRYCHDAQCDMAIVDLSRNRSKLFCDFGNCANRSHVRAYRARQAAERRAARASAGSSAAAASQEDPAREASAGEAEDAHAITRSKPSAAEKAAQLAEPTSESAVAAKAYRSQMRDELMEKRKKDKKKKKKQGGSSSSTEA